MVITYCIYILNVNFCHGRKLLNISSFILEKHPVFLRGFLVNRHPWRFYFAKNLSETIQNLSSKKNRVIAGEKYIENIE